MDCRNIVIYLSQLNNYPVKLAQKIGLERAALWYELFRRYGETTFQFVESIPLLLGITKARECFDSLYSLGYLIKNEDGTYGIDFDKIFEVTDGASLNAEIKPPFSDTRFITLLNDYIRFLKEKGRKTDKRSLYKQFDGQTLEVSINALKLALNNRWITLFFNDKGQRSTKTAYGGGKGGGRSTSGGGTNENRAGGFSATEI
jgi:hypothetical protein